MLMYSTKVNHKFLFPFACLVGMSTIQFGFALAGNNAVGPYLADRDSWVKKNGSETAVAAIIAVGLGIGSFIGGFMVQLGRRKIIIIMNIVGAIGTAITLIDDFWIIFFGKAVFAFSTGVLLVAAPLMLEETIPVQAIGFYGAFTNMFVVFGLSIEMFMAGVLPTEGDSDFETSNLWRLIYSLNFIPQIISLIGFIFFVRTDSLKYHLEKEQHE